MLYMIEGAQAEDDGSCWEYKPDVRGYSLAQTRELSLILLHDDLRALSVGTEVVVDSALAQEIEKIVPAARGLGRRVTVRGPQPLMLPKPDMVQLGPIATARLAAASIERDAEGNVIKLKTPFVLDARSQVPEPTICKIEDNQLTIFSEAVKDLLSHAEPRLSFRAIGVENEPIPAVTPTKLFRLPSAEELKKRRG